MTFHHSIRVLTVAAMLCTAMPSFAAEPAPPFAPGCKKPHYPWRAAQAKEEGFSLLGFLVRADGTVARTVVLNSSGSEELDRTAEAALSKCVFNPVGKDANAVEHWRRVTYAWHLYEPFMLRLQRAAALAGNNGDLQARYRLSRLLSDTAKTDADRENALTVLRSAAELGHAHAQFDLGRHYEKGKGVEANLEEAMRWYEKSAAQSDPLAMQRLALGKLTD